MSERLFSPSVESRIEEIIVEHVDNIRLYLEIFKQLPEKQFESDDYEYSKQDSLIVLTDTKSHLGLRAAEYMIGYDELQNQMDDNEMADTAIGLLNRDDVYIIFENYGRNTKPINLPDFCENEVTVLIISDESRCISINLNRNRQDDF